LRTANHLSGDDGNVVALDDGEKKRQGLIRTIPRSTPRYTCGRKCRARPHLYAAPRSQTDPKYAGSQQFELLVVGCDPEGEAGIG
jgi:hypothetical protein